jgi:hypothetical protein
MRWTRSAQSWLWLVLIAFLAIRLGGAHLHLCFDGQEPPAAVHMADGSIHDDAHHAEAEHTDRDVQVFDAAVVKKAGGSADLLAAVFVVAILLLLAPPAGAFRQRANDAPVFRRTLFVLRPPLRGPPL